MDDMGRPRKLIPNLTHHKSSGQAKIFWNGKNYYLGIYGSQESLDNYQKMISNIISTGHPAPEVVVKPSIRDVIPKYLEYLEESYPKECKEPVAIARALKTVLGFYGPLQADLFSPARLIELRAKWIAKPMSMTTVNRYHQYLLNMFQWLGMMDVISASVWHSLRTVKKLQPKRSAAKDPKKVHPVNWEHVEAIKDYVSDECWAIIMFQWHTGARSGEALKLTMNQIKDNVYKPEKHKNLWRGHKREIHIGPQARELLIRWSKGKSPDALVFEGYTSSSYWKAVSRACNRAGVPHWHPHMIRHRVATSVRAKHGLDGAQVVMGHASARTTEIYAEPPSSERGKEIAEENG